MKIDDLYTNGMKRIGFWKRKMGYAGHALAVILLLSREELASKFQDGRRDNGHVTDKGFMYLNADAEFKDEMCDGYWYHLWKIAQKKHAKL